MSRKSKEEIIKNRIKMDVKISTNEGKNLFNRKTFVFTKGEDSESIEAYDEHEAWTILEQRVFKSYNWTLQK